MLASEIARLVDGRLLGEDVAVDGIDSLVDAGPAQLSSIIWPKDIRLAKKTKAGLLLCSIDHAADYAHEISSALIVVRNLGLSFFRLRDLVVNGTLRRGSFSKIATSAKIHASAVVGECVSIGEETIIEAGVVLHDHVRVGAFCKIGANSVIGAPAFVPFGEVETMMLPSLGSVEIDDHVDIGALCSVDRGLLSTTRIKSHTLVDNMVHIGHDSVVGRHVVIAGQTGLSGFVRIKDFVTLGGQVGVLPHVVIEEAAQISGKSMVHCDIKAREIWSGNPSVPHALYLRAYGKQRARTKDI